MLQINNLLQCTSAKNYRLTHVEVTNEDKVGFFIETPCTFLSATNRKRHNRLCDFSILYYRAFADKRGWLSDNELFVAFFSFHFSLFLLVVIIFLLIFSFTLPSFPLLDCFFVCQTNTPSERLPSLGLVLGIPYQTSSLTVRHCAPSNNLSRLIYSVYHFEHITTRHFMTGQSALVVACAAYDALQLSILHYITLHYSFSL